MIRNLRQVPVIQHPDLRRNMQYNFGKSSFKNFKILQKFDNVNKTFEKFKAISRNFYKI